MNIIQSCWTAPMTTTGQERWNVNNQIEKNLWLYGYSVDYLQILGQNIDLHTDSYGTSVFNCIPYKNIYSTLDGLTGKVNERFWSAGKIKALEVSDLNAIHIDGDVFLKNQTVLDALNMAGYDCIVQMPERMNVFMESYSQTLPMFQDVIGNKISGLTYNLTEALNCGVLGFTNQKMKDDFINGYYEILEMCQNNQDFMSLLKYDLQKKIEPNVVAEQYYLKSLATVGKYKVKHLIDLTSDNFNDDWITMNEQADELGFAHAWGSSKYSIIPAIKEILKQRNPSLYNAIIDKIVEINNI